MYMTIVYNNNKHVYYRNRIKDTVTFDLTIKDFSANCINEPGKMRYHYICQKLRNALGMYQEHITDFTDYIESEECDFTKFPTKEHTRDTPVSIVITLRRGC